MVRFFQFCPLVAVVALLAATLSLGAYGDDSKAKAKKSAKELTNYYFTVWQPPSPDWEVRKVRPGKEIDLTIDTKIANKTLTKKIMERSRMEQMEIARMACPDYTDEIWSKIDKKQTVGIMLSGSAGHIINALCKRP